MDFLLATLKANRASKYADIKAAADKRKLKVYPIMFGRAQAILGIVKAAPRGHGKAAKAKAGRTTAVARRGPGRPRKTANAAASMNGLDSIVAMVKSSHQDLDRFRGALEKIRLLIADSLA
jgi:hypothetical protein